MSQVSQQRGLAELPFSTLGAGFSSPSHRWQDLCQAHRAQGDLVAPNKERLDLLSLVDAHYIPYMSHLGPLASGPSRATPDATCFLNYHLRKWTGIDFMDHRLAPSGVSVLCYADLLGYVLFLNDMHKYTWTYIDIMSLSISSKGNRR
jgi:hypothetical protein